MNDTNTKEFIKEDTKEFPKEFLKEDTKEDIKENTNKNIKKENIKKDTKTVASSKVVTPKTSPKKNTNKAPIKEKELNWTSKPLMKGAEPFALLGKTKTAFLFIHGFGGSPYQIKPLAQHLHKQGHNVFAILLGGHGTETKDMLEFSYDDWFTNVDKIYLKLRKKYNKVIVIGFSLGGTLALKIAAKYDTDKNKPDGLVTIATPLFFNRIYDNRIIISHPLMLFLPFAKFFPDLLDLLKIEKYLSFIFCRGGKVTFEPSEGVGYARFLAVPTWVSCTKAIKALRKDLHKIVTPYCSIAMQEDRTVPASNQFYIFSRVRSNIKRMYTFSVPSEKKAMTHRIVINKNVQKQIFSYTDEFIVEALKKSE